MIKFGGKSQFVLSKKADRDFLNFIFLHLAIFFLIFSPHLPHLSNFSVNDLVGFSRGAATAYDFGNLILSDGVTNYITNQEKSPNQQIKTRRKSNKLQKN